MQFTCQNNTLDTQNVPRYGPHTSGCYTLSHMSEKWYISVGRNPNRYAVIRETLFHYPCVLPPPQPSLQNIRYAYL